MISPRPRPKSRLAFQAARSICRAAEESPTRYFWRNLTSLEDAFLESEPSNAHLSRVYMDTYHTRNSLPDRYVLVCRPLSLPVVHLMSHNAQCQIISPKTTVTSVVVAHSGFSVRTLPTLLLYVHTPVTVSCHARQSKMVQDKRVIRV